MNEKTRAYCDDVKAQVGKNQELPVGPGEYPQAMGVSEGLMSAAVREKTVEEEISDARHAIGLAADLIKAAAGGLERAAAKRKVPFLKWWNDGGHEIFRGLSFSGAEATRLADYAENRARER